MMPAMTWPNCLRAVLILLAPALVLGCAAVPAERLGSVPPRSPVTAQEQEKVFAIDVYDPFEGLNRRVYNFNARFDRYSSSRQSASTIGLPPTSSKTGSRASSTILASSGTA